MSGISALHSGLFAVRTGLARLDAAAATVTSATLPAADGAPSRSDDLVGSLVEMMLARRDVEAGAAVVARASDIQKSLLDIFI